VGCGNPRGSDPGFVSVVAVEVFIARRVANSARVQQCFISRLINIILNNILISSFHINIL
jgi:hypothetical protein